MGSKHCFFRILTRYYLVVQIHKPVKRYARWVLPNDRHLSRTHIAQVFSGFVVAYDEYFARLTGIRNCLRCTVRAACHAVDRFAVRMSFVSV